MFIFKFLLLIFITLFVVNIAIASKFIRTFRNTINKQNNRTQRTNNQYHRYSPNENVIDTRDEKEINKKIFKKDEGEYVDFKEES